MNLFIRIFLIFISLATDGLLLADWFPNLKMFERDLLDGNLEKIQVNDKEYFHFKPAASILLNSKIIEKNGAIQPFIGVDSIILNFVLLGQDLLIYIKKIHTSRQKGISHAQIAAVQCNYYCQYQNLSVKGAGEIYVKDGYIRSINDKSGHYRADGIKFLPSMLRKLDSWDALPKLISIELMFVKDNIPKLDNPIFPYKILPIEVQKSGFNLAYLQDKLLTYASKEMAKSNFNLNFFNGNSSDKMNDIKIFTSIY